MTSKRITGVAIASTAAIAVAGFGLASTAGATTTASSGSLIKKAEIRLRGDDDVRMKVKTARRVDKVTFTYAGETYKARRSHETPGEWKRTVDHDEDATQLAFSVTACDGDDCVTKSYSGTGDRVRSGSDDSSSHDAGDDKGGTRSGGSSDDGPSHDAGDDKGGSSKSSSGSSSGSGSGSSGDDNGNRHGGHGSDD